MERTFIMIKVDGVQRNLVGEIISRFERRGYTLKALKMKKPTIDHMQLHYIDLKSKPFYTGLCKFMSSGPVVAMVWEGKDAVRQGRSMLGETDPLKSRPGTIRGDFGIDLGRNIVHGSDSPASAEKEISLWFTPSELIDWKCLTSGMVYE
ncbi:hypothetical protein A3Q56_01051 [Intoshia linei]|uniref:Nucleoside diphosphate kinase n=1 Tax=Intoshia linei TaxID=1819745 RepID=A0A177BC29_9BILA|nr:hypothetical protein A3Q56_01051 [Intoshia linei]